MKKSSIKPTQKKVYVCYRGYTDPGGDRVRRGQEFIYEGVCLSGYYFMEHASGRGITKFVAKEEFTSHFCPAN